MRPYLEKKQHKTELAEWLKVVECLSSKCEALSSNPSTERERERKRRGESERWVNKGKVIWQILEEEGNPLETLGLEPTRETSPIYFH
jgi:hypothetical protein